MGIEYGKFLFIPSVKNKQMDELDLEKYNKLMIVAHPDDELIWGGVHLLEDDYLVVCITRGYDKTRKKEFENVIEATGDKGKNDQKKTGVKTGDAFAMKAAVAGMLISLGMACVVIIRKRRK